MSLRNTIVGIAVSRGFTRAFRAVLVSAALIAALAGLARAQANPPCALVDARVTVVPAYESQIKHGNSTCYGALVGQLPACDCSVPAGDQSWGQLKFFYR